MTTRHIFYAALTGLGYFAGIVAANYLTSHFGLIPAGFGLLVTAGTYCAGLVLVLRNSLQDLAGRRAVLACIVIGATLSWLLGSGRIAIASGVTFLIAETLDMLVYTKLRQRGWRRAVLAGTWLGAVLDTTLFLDLAGFPLTWHSIGGQLLVKALWVTGTYFAVMEVARRVVPRQRLQSEDPRGDDLGRTRADRHA